MKVKISNIYDYTYAPEDVSPGDVIDVVVRKREQDMEGLNVRSEVLP